MAANFGFDMTTEGKTNDDILLREDLLTLLPMLHEANAMSEELNKKVCNFACVWGGGGGRDVMGGIRAGCDGGHSCGM